MRPLLILPLLGAAAVLTSLALTARPQDTLDAPLHAESLELLDELLATSQQAWPERMPAARAAMERSPRGVIEHLVAKLAVDQPAAGWPLESQVYNVCGNALTLLEELTGERICGQGRDWIGFRTLDHRGAQPSREEIQGPWETWLAVRAELSVDEWFWGLSYPELGRLAPLLRKAQDEWTAEELEAVRELGARAYPYLLDKLLDDEFALSGLRHCDQANALLRELTGQNLGELERKELLKLSPDDPARKHRLAVSTNRASKSLMQRRWTSVLLVE